jgi:hypothetical protein
VKQLETTTDIENALKVMAPIENVHEPMKIMIRRVRNGNSEYQKNVKSIRKVL